MSKADGADRLFGLDRIPFDHISQLSWACLLNDAELSRPKEVLFLRVEMLHHLHTRMELKKRV